MNNTAPTFAKQDNLKFFRTLNSRVNNYFKENNIQKTGNWKLHLKAIILFAVFLTPYFLILTLNMPFWAQLLLNILMGVGMAGIGMNVMHDGNHGSYSSKSWINKIMGGSIYVLAGNVHNWQVQHNVLHHTYTNIHGHDEDLDAGRIIRFTQNAEWRRFHKFQHYYSFFLYGLLTFNWALTTDFKQMKDYIKRKLSYGAPQSPTKLWTVLVITKIIYILIWIALPMILGVIWWKVVIGFFVMHYTAGLILSIVFQLAHVVEETSNPVPNEDGEIENTWAIHQLYTTANFAPKNKVVNWFTGGLNHQIEHHIFPNISHIHYGKIAEIVKQTAIECNLPYHEFKTMRGAVLAHYRHLRDLGIKPELA
ncbi:MULTISPECIES: acyl-CoA desaturase [Flavobacterium]|jgi:linoleoyl-CoA desaturase|uniref:Acyl-CoA desaturase n=1 Tax=Flavobacterium tructae TaxID=1114873 RepID=A0A1S1IY16_9FLAO|nr:MULTISPECIES: acyl-CoA desaturase [Flavobacterium]MDL2145019.1 acyl-CoA desaturase [Flavobacterium tructae]OHT43257.1 fatty acid desaturase [Flavobacterium tructae]OXB19862.1 acyl-CoA desaturase [Flavobacterium tructae]OXB23420.1 acyl-CoA desaturase [Flavobacterium tructae]URC14451.1 acyl-CoA desaturase [Flavobacterium sp. B183]